MKKSAIATDLNELSEVSFTILGQPRIQTFEDRYVIDKISSCWNWIGNSYNGYGLFWNKGKQWKAHRFSYFYFIGTIPKGMNICHRCDNPACVNPEHLFLGTQKDNMQDMLKKGRGPVVSGEKHPRAILDFNRVKEIKERISNGESITKIAKDFTEVTRSVLYAIKYRKIWKDA